MSNNNTSNNTQTTLSENLVTQAIGNFHGGINPREFKTLSNSSESQKLNLPAELVIPLNQSIGVESKPIVSVGDKVVKGQLIALSNAVISANIHSPVCGIIKAVQTCDTGHVSGLPKLAIIILTQGIEQTQNSLNSAVIQWQNVSREQLLLRVEQAGIVGLGGATFPTNIKLSSNKIQTLIVNAMECEPYITCDDRLLREKANEIIQGAYIAAYISNANEIIFAIEDNKPEAIKALKSAIITSLPNQESQQEPSIKIVVAPTKYPSGGEKQMIELVLNKQIPKGKLPSSIGVLVQNTATLFAINNAIAYQQNLTERLVTITGDLVKAPGNYWLPFGTQLNHIIEALDIPQELCGKVIFGGPLMGQSINSFDVPTTKSTNCIIFNNKNNNDKNWLTENSQHQACIRCGDCEKVCPIELLPQQLYWFSQSEQWEALEQQDLFDCIECGACAYVCPSEIPLVQYYKFGKSSIKNNRLKSQISENAKKRFEFREMRIQRAKDERALKHKKAAAARRKAAENKDTDPSGKKTAINAALERVKKKKADALLEAKANFNEQQDKH